jgi:outer membrane autotransporter protein
MSFASERAAAFPSDVALAYASVLKAPAVYKPHWTTWGAAFGGGSTTNGDPAGAGTNSVSARTGGFAVGIDDHVAPDTVVGVALAGGGVNWGLGAGLGGGRGDTFLAGLYGSKQSGPAYVAGALTFSSNWMTTSRSISVAGPDTLTAAFNAQNFGGRLEGGYRVPAAVALNITPYAAAQAQTFHSPTYRETGAPGAPDPFALMFNAQSATVVRTELGSRFDQMFAQADAGTINLFSRVAWAHDWQSNPNLAATFIGLPAATFVVNGAAAPSDLALLTAGAEWRWRTSWSVMAKFDGEFASASKTYAGTATLKYAW